MVLPAFGAVCAGTKTAVTALQWIKKGWDLSRNPDIEELQELWYALDSLTKPLEVAVMLCRRERTQPYVDSAVHITRRSVRKVEELLERGQDIEDKRPDDEASWMRWKKKVSGAVDFRTRISSLMLKLTDARQALTLALAAATAAVAETERLPLAPFSWMPSVYERSYSLLTSVKLGRFPMEEESARPVGIGSAWVSKGKAEWALLGRVELLLHSASEDDIGLVTRAVKTSALVEDEDEPEEGTVRVPLRPTAKVSKCWGKSAAETAEQFSSGGSFGISVLPEDLVYFISSEEVTIAIAYEGIGAIGEGEVYEKAISAEVFEVFVGMLIHRNAIDEWDHPDQELRRWINQNNSPTMQYGGIS